MKSVKVIGLVMFFLLSTTSFSWNFRGHVVIAQIAYSQLSTTQQQELDQLAEKIYERLPKKAKATIAKQYPGANRFAQLAFLPDYWRLWKIKTLFHKFDSPIPSDLVSIENQSTKSWHFINLDFPNTGKCQITKKYNIEWAIPVLINDIKLAKNENEKALLLIELSHLVGDAHQPLHGYSRVTSSCEEDQGGNKVCLYQSRNGRCSLSLHALWDRGVGYIRNTRKIKQLAKTIKIKFPESSLSSYLNNLNPSDWVNENYHYLSFIYSAKSEPLTKQYKKEGKSIAEKQMAIAGYQLSKIIGSIFGN